MYKILIISFLMFSMLFVAGSVNAATFGLEQTAENAGYDLGTVSPASTVKSVVTVILGLVAVAFFALTLYAGFIWMTARGKEDVVDNAKNILESAILGLIIVAAAYAVATFVINRLASGDIAGCCTLSDDSGQIISQKTANECLDLGGSWFEGKCPQQ